MESPGTTTLDRDRLEPVGGTDDHSVTHRIYRVTRPNSTLTGRHRSPHHRHGLTRVENRSHSCRAARGSRKPVDVIAETAQFADHLARPHLLRFFADGWSAFLIANALVKNLPNQTTQPVGDGATGLRMPEARDESSIHDREDRPLGLHGGI